MASQSHVAGPQWTFLTNYAHVLVLMAEEPMVRTRDLALRVGITERAVQRIVADLVDAGYVTRQRIGRRNRYVIQRDRSLRHPVEAGFTLGDLLQFVEAKRCASS
ncbi:helix-turn-helix transcriptional regulator [Sulfobacillus harzensis]|uniref:Winged helix-turn-helix transcriptional regulator n=1 Tax=Sulfobacillus harzensis TaxID=2729629 RepID=A0A7Y0Q2J8_9FIRM|nr:winged helix-turn-helix domain-containing protein [Sulfobacillus harzensis]NMP22415.1 winged helix-turn-helix transcriptional regulator [Sulfobacillus harzensis]